MMLKLIGDDFDDNLVNRVCEQVLTDRVRSPTDRQRLPLRARLGVQNTKVLSIIELMEANLSEPLSLIEVADHRRPVAAADRASVPDRDGPLAGALLSGDPARPRPPSAHPVDRCRWSRSRLPAASFRRRTFSKCYRELYARSPQQERLDRKQLLAA